jgi:hypothetical protein
VRVVLLLIFLLVLVACETEGPVELRTVVPADVVVDEAAAQQALKAIGSSPVRLCAADVDRGSPRSHLLAWLNQRVTFAQRYLEQGRAEAICYDLRGARLADRSYGLVRHGAQRELWDDAPGRDAERRRAARRFPPLAASKDYVEVRFLWPGIGCPEFHGVIDPSAPKVLSLWSEGG